MRSLEKNEELAEDVEQEPTAPKCDRKTVQTKLEVCQGFRCTRQLRTKPQICQVFVELTTRPVELSSTVVSGVEEPDFRD